ncbi:thioredoxin domain-containing protein [Gordonia sp. CPCC 205333]|uniref:thioredoxin domain-containing protein n=1 Tax=Gordonia sp. CPCC 205333 TaxID=3140790 RepID=UPI003AF33360
MNRLTNATSPYLRQHADNPVHWREWGEDAFADAIARDVPVLLSVGYAACHWCHVMAHECFEDDEIAAQMNAEFVCIKVDREERPDIDAIYMNATVAMTGQGGWPMTCFLAPTGQPFYCGTYFPPRPRNGQPGFVELMTAITDTWINRREEVARVGQELAGHLSAASSGLPDADTVLDDELAVQAASTLVAQEDRVHGGFGGAPKFPPSAQLEALLRHHERTGDVHALGVVERTAQAMARGGIYDQLGGGFSRYTVDIAWAIPHFEKMLYDNAQLLRVYAHLACVGSAAAELAAKVVGQTVDFLVSDLRVVGGFASSLDADTDGVEGATYVWTRQEFDDLLGDDSDWAAKIFAVTDAGTFEHGTSTLQLPVDPDDAERFASVCHRLSVARERRPQPGRDDKVVSAWNGMAITGLVEASMALARPDWIDLAAWCAGEILTRHVVDGELRRTSLGGVVGTTPGMLDDHAALVTGLLSLSAATGQRRWLDAAITLLDKAVELFKDPAADGSWFDAPDGVAGLITRPRDPADGATPSGGSLMAEALLTASMLAPPEKAGVYLELADATLRRAAVLLAKAPRAAGHWLAVTQARLSGPIHVTATSSELLSAARSLGRGGMLVTEAGAGVSANQPSGTVMVCKGTACSLPVRSIDDLVGLL